MQVSNLKCEKNEVPYVAKDMEEHRAKSIQSNLDGQTHLFSRPKAHLS